MESFETRVERLEREMRKWRVVACLACGVVAIALLTAAAAPRKGPDDIRAGKIILLDQQHRPVGELSGSGLFLRQASGEIRLQIAAAGPQLSLQAKEQDTRVALGMEAGGMPSLVFMRKSAPRAVLRVDQKGSGLAIHDAEGIRRAALGHATIEYPLTGRVQELPEGSVAIFDKRGRVEWQAPEPARRP